MSRPHYLMITEKLYIARMFEKVLTRMENEAPLSFDIDIVPANNHVYNNRSMVTLSIDSECNSNELRIGNRTIHGYTVVTSGYMDGVTPMVKMMLEQNNYDAIVNACSPNVEGDLKFKYMLASLGIDTYPIRRLNVDYFTEDVIERELNRLNN